MSVVGSRYVFLVVIFIKFLNYYFYSMSIGS